MSTNKKKPKLKNISATKTVKEVGESGVESKAPHYDTEAAPTSSNTNVESAKDAIDDSTQVDGRPK